MNFDAITLAAVRDEVAPLVGGRVQHVHLPDELGLALEVYAGGARHWLYCSAHPQRARVHLVAARLARPSDQVTPLLLLARKYVDGARLEAVEQPPLERVLRLRFSQRLDDGTIAGVDLIVEAMGRNSNLILVDANGTILDAARRVTPEMSRVRPVLPRGQYVLPPEQAKLDPRRVAGQSLAALAARHPADRPLREALVAEVNACSPLLAREVTVRALGRLDVAIGEVGDAGWDATAAALHALWAGAAAGEWAPCLAYEGDHIRAYAAYDLTSFADRRPVPSISAALEAWFGRAPAQPEADAARKAALRQALLAAADRLRGKRYSLQQGLVSPGEIARLREAGEALLAYAAGVPAGEPAFTPPGAAEPIALNPALGAVENAQRYFARYAKARAAARDVPAMIAATDNELRYLDEALTHLDLAASPADLAALRSEWATLGYVARAGRSRDSRAAGAQRSPRTGGGKGAAGKSGRRGPGGVGRPDGATGVSRLTLDGFEVLVGRSGAGNDALLTREAHPDDVWLHARGIPGAHVLIRTRGREVPDAVLRRAAAMAAARSQARQAPSVGVDYTRRRYVERIKGAPPGLVTYRGEKTIHVAPATGPG
jgi:predicted ribosome quality control (RQC) complex YloA/Tae2 family protein